MLRANKMMMMMMMMTLERLRFNGRHWRHSLLNSNLPGDLPGAATPAPENPRKHVTVTNLT